MVVDSTVLACDRMMAERLRRIADMNASAVMLAIQLGMRAGPMRTRAMELIASEVRLNRMIAVASEISRNRACTSRNSTTAKAMMIWAAARTRRKSCALGCIGPGLVTGGRSLVCSVPAVSAVPSTIDKTGQRSIVAGRLYCDGQRLAVLRDGDAGAVAAQMRGQQVKLDPPRVGVGQGLTPREPVPERGIRGQPPGGREADRPARRPRHVDRAAARQGVHR